MGGLFLCFPLHRLWSIMANLVTKYVISHRDKLAWYQSVDQSCHGVSEILSEHL